MSVSLKDTVNALSVNLATCVLQTPSEIMEGSSLAALTAMWADRLQTEEPEMDPIVALSIGRQVAPLPIMYTIRRLLTPSFPMIEAMRLAFGNITDPDAMAYQVGTLLPADMLLRVCLEGLEQSANLTEVTVAAAKEAYRTNGSVEIIVGTAIVNALRTQS